MGGSSKICNGGSKKSHDVYPLKMNGDIEIPVKHERSTNSTPTPRIKEVRFDEGSRRRKRYSLPVEINIDKLHEDQNGNQFVGLNQEGIW